MSILWYFIGLTLGRQRQPANSYKYDNNNKNYYKNNQMNYIYNK